MSSTTLNTPPRIVNESNGRVNTKKVAITAIMTAVETIATMMIAISIPASEGYFNVGEAIIFFTAIIFGPFIGAFVGGVGAALADLLLGYYIFAPATLIGKGLEGFMVGFLYLRLSQSELLTTKWKSFTILLGMIVAGLLIGLGLFFTQGELVIGWSFGSSISIPEIENYFWIVLGLITMVMIWIIGLGLKQNVSTKVISILLGGICMVLTYFLYEIPVKGLDPALFEMPFNVIQVILGLLLALPIIATYEKTKI